MILTKYHYHVLMTKDLFQTIEFILWLIFMKIVSQAVKKFKKLWPLKKIVIIEKDREN